MLNALRKKFIVTIMFLVGILLTVLLGVMALIPIRICALICRLR